MGHILSSTKTQKLNETHFEESVSWGGRGTGTSRSLQHRGYSLENTGSLGQDQHKEIVKCTKNEGGGGGTPKTRGQRANKRHGGTTIKRPGQMMRGQKKKKRGGEIFFETFTGGGELRGGQGVSRDAKEGRDDVWLNRRGTEKREKVVARCCQVSRPETNREMG